MYYSMHIEDSPDNIVTNSISTVGCRVESMQHVLAEKNAPHNSQMQVDALEHHTYQCQ